MGADATGEPAPHSDASGVAAFNALVAAGPARPILTYYDERTGERTELSGATLDNWVAKTANLLVDGLGLGPGDPAALWLPPHWQTAAVLLGCWSAGLPVAFGPADDGDARVAFAAVDVITAGPAGALAPGADERYALGLHPLAAPLAAPPPGWADYVAEVRGHGDRYSGPRVPPGAAAWLAAEGDVLSHAALAGYAAERAAALGVPPAGRVLIDGEAHPDPREWLLAPIVAGASVVLVVGADPRRLGELATTERTDAVIGPAPVEL